MQIRLLHQVKQRQINVQTNKYVWVYLTKRQIFASRKKLTMQIIVGFHTPY